MGEQRAVPEPPSSVEEVYCAWSEQPAVVRSFDDVEFCGDCGHALPSAQHDDARRASHPEHAHDGSCGSYAHACGYLPTSVELRPTRHEGLLVQMLGRVVRGGLHTCEALARRGTGTGSCGQPLDGRGQCPRAGDHIEATS